MILRVIQASCLPHTDNASAFSSHVTDDIVGDMILHGKKEFIAALPETSSRELGVGKSITHGPDASANGYMILKNGSPYDCCEAYEFSAAKGTMIKGITSCVIEQPNTK